MAQTCTIVKASDRKKPAGNSAGGVGVLVLFRRESRGEVGDGSME
jgi:hypothetical protein